MLTAYFDESGTHRESPITAIGGFVATDEAWKKFELELAEILALYAGRGLRVFHMVDSLAQQGQFSSIEQIFINQILWGIGKALRRAKVVTVYSAVVQDDWDAVVTDGPFKARFPKPFDLCFEDTLRQLYEWAGRYAKGVKVSPVFSFQKEYHERMTAVSAALDLSGKYAKHLSSVVIAKPEVVTPLQAADFAAYSMRGNIEKHAYWQGLAAGGSTVVFDHATNGEHTHGNWYEKDGLKITMKHFTETGEI